MKWTPWIETATSDTSDDQVRPLYDRTRDRTSGNPPDMVRLNSLTPNVAGLTHDLQRAIYHGAHGLSVREKEITALIVSALNGCVH